MADIEDLRKKLQDKPGDINLILDISDKYFGMQDYESCMELLLSNYPKHKDKIKNKMVEFFDVLETLMNIQFHIEKNYHR